MLATDGDDRVDPLHARKFVANAQFSQAGHSPILFRLERNAGHGGGSISQYADQKRSIERWNDIYSFLFWQLKN